MLLVTFVLVAASVVKVVVCYKSTTEYGMKRVLSVWSAVSPWPDKTSLLIIIATIAKWITKHSLPFAVLDVPKRLKANASKLKRLWMAQRWFSMRVVIIVLNAKQNSKERVLILSMAMFIVNNTTMRINHNQCS